MVGDYDAQRHNRTESTTIDENLSHSIDPHVGTHVVARCKGERKS